jgi:lipopolysaccharide/colanic/teichoic acid biosynthesis glycosyltransferase
MKRLFDLILASSLIIVLSPIFLLTWLLIKLDSHGPGIFRQERIGKLGSSFIMYKFRSMYAAQKEPGNFQTDPADSRITRVGRFIRKTSIDELPQLFNILKGDMSFVGPRPDVAAQRHLYSDQEFVLRQSMLPGITGLAQCRARHYATAKQRKCYDLFYAKKHSLGLDMRIIFWTLLSLRKGSF